MATKRRPADWLELFDTSQMDHVCDSVRVNIINVSLGEPSEMHAPLRRWLLAPIDAYLAAHWKAGRRQDHVLAAERFRDTVERLAENFEDRYPFAEDDGEPWATSLRSAWLEFIAYGAAPRMYWDIPNTTKRARKSAQAQRNGWPKYLTTADVVAVMATDPPPSKYEAVISALCDKARANVPKGLEHPKGDPDSTARRQYRAAVKLGKVKAISQRR